MSTSVLNAPACFHHPVKVIFLDDNQAFLDMLSLEFGHHRNMLMLTDPDDALHLINQNNSFFSESQILKNNLQNNLLDIIYNKSRYNNVAVLVIDYEMPTINGIDFCEKLTDKTIFKILLTAEADKDIAIRAFNNGTIDKYILKTNDNLYAEVLESIDDLTNRYFHELSKVPLRVSGDILKTLVNQERYKEIFHEVKSHSNAVEHYLIDRSGIFLTKNAQPTWLFISNQQKAEEDGDLLLGYGFPSDLIKQIRQQTKILFLLSDSEYKEPSTQWNKYIFNAEKLDDNHSYSIVSGPVMSSIHWDTVASYEENHLL